MLHCSVWLPQFQQLGGNSGGFVDFTCSPCEHKGFLTEFSELQVFGKYQGFGVCCKISIEDLCK